MYIFSLFFFKKYSININNKFCLNCVKNINKLKSKCNKCPSELILKDIKIESVDKTFNEIIYNKKSIARFGDGEMNLIFGGNIGFQNYDKKLVQRLLEVLKSREKNLLIGIFVPYKKKELNSYKKGTIEYLIKWVNKNKFNIIKILNKNIKYYSSIITRFYIFYENSKASFSIKKWRKIWDNRSIVIVEGEKTRAGIGNNLFNNTKSIKRIICPSINAYKLYDKILNCTIYDEIQR